MSLVIDKQKNFSFYITGALLLSALVFCRFLPQEFGWENGLFENAQVVVLALGVFVSIALGIKLPKGYKSIGYLAAATFFFCIARELSWGRVFLLKEYTEHGPMFKAMKTIPFHRAIEWGIGVYVIMLVLGVIFLFPWKKILKMPVPLYLIISMLLCFFFAQVGEMVPNVILMNHDQGQVFEEMTELILHVLMVWTVYLYGKRILDESRELGKAESEKEG